MRRPGKPFNSTVNRSWPPAAALTHFLLAEADKGILGTAIFPSFSVFEKLHPVLIVDPKSYWGEGEKGLFSPACVAWPVPLNNVFLQLSCTRCNRQNSTQTRQGILFQVNCRGFSPVNRASSINWPPLFCQAIPPLTRT